MTSEAQNALLKLFEEPPSNTHFFLCVGSVSELLPTLCSRVHVLEGEIATVAPLEFHTQFLGASVAARIALLEPILKERDTAAAANLLRGIEQALALQSRTNENRKAVQHILAVRGALAGKGASLKALLESVALATPVVS